MAPHDDVQRSEPQKHNENAPKATLHLSNHGSTMAAPSGNPYAPVQPRLPKIGIFLQDPAPWVSVALSSAMATAAP